MGVLGWWVTAAAVLKRENFSTHFSGHITGTRLMKIRNNTSMAEAELLIDLLTV